MAYKVFKSKDRNKGKRKWFDTRRIFRNKLKQDKLGSYFNFIVNFYKKRYNNVRYGVILLVTIKFRNKRIKVFNLIFLVLVFCLVFYLLLSLFFHLPFFRSGYSYDHGGGNYKINTKVTFNNKWFKCYVTEVLTIKNIDKTIYDKYVKDLKYDGYKHSGKDIYKRTYKINSFCDSAKKDYKKNQDENYILFKLNGDNSYNIEYKSDFTDPYVVSKINGKDTKKVDVFSNLNNNKTGSYVISYDLKVDNYYTKRLYRVINVVDTKKPVINLVGEENVTLEYGSKYVEEGFSAADDYDGDITSKVKVKNTVDTKKPGTYKITYNVTDSNGNKSRVYRKVTIKEKNSVVSKVEPVIEQKDGITYINGILMVNKDYALPKTYDPKVNKEAYKALVKMQSDASLLGLDLSLVSGYRSYEVQDALFKKYALKDGEEKANTYSAKPGHSEHQTGLAFDIGSVDKSFENTSEAKWIEQNAHLYGFIVRYPKGKTDITGYIYEPWHVRYLGVDTATKVKESGLTLEEYVGIK